MESSLKSAALLELMKKHLETDAGKQLKEKVGLVYQLNISPKVLFFFFLLIDALLMKIGEIRYLIFNSVCFGLSWTENWIQRGDLRGWS